MPRIRLLDAQPGQRLTRPAATRTGQVMVRPGTELTTAIIERLGNLGIDAVFVEGPPGEGERSAEDVLGGVQARFAGHEQDPWMMELKDIVTRVLRSNFA